MLITGLTHILPMLHFYFNIGRIWVKAGKTVATEGVESCRQKYFRQYLGNEHTKKYKM